MKRRGKGSLLLLSWTKRKLCEGRRKRLKG
jgi:hypothetical protein